MKTGRKTEIAAVVLIVTPLGIPLVRDPAKPSPIFWKLPGGHGEAGEDARMCAVREAKEETGLDLSDSELKEVDVMAKDSHTLTIFQAKLSSLDGLQKEGNEGEEVRVFSPSEILSMDDFMPNHYSAVSHILLGLTKAA